MTRRRTRPRTLGLFWIALSAASIAVARPVQAEEPFIPPPYVPPAPAEPSDFAPTVMQALAGLVIPIAAVGLARDSEMAAPIFLFTPLVLGGAICGFGKLDPAHQGSCAATIGIAYAGALAVLPLAVVGLVIDGGRDSPDSNWLERDYTMTMVMAGVGWFVVQPAVALLGWHGTKRPRAATLLPAPPPRPSARATQRMPGQVTTALAAFTF